MMLGRLFPPKNGSAPGNCSLNSVSRDFLLDGDIASTSELDRDGWIGDGGFARRRIRGSMPL